MENNNEYNLPMILMEKLSKASKERIVITVDVDYNICIHINNIDRLYKKKYLSNLEGRGLTYRDACINYINNLMDSNYRLRYKSKFYITTKLRNIIKKSNYKVR